MLGENKRNKAIFLVAYRHGLRASEVGLFRADSAKGAAEAQRTTAFKYGMPIASRAMR